MKIIGNAIARPSKAPFKGLMVITMPNMDEKATIAKVMAIYVLGKGPMAEYVPAFSVIVTPSQDNFQQG